MSVSPPASATPVASTLFPGYQPPPGVYDESCAAPAQVREAWGKFGSMLENVGSVEVAHRWEQARRMLHESGVTYNPYGDPEGTNRPWELDAIPLIVNSAEWKQISAAMTQRATLLNLILGDLYGPQRMLAEGLVPASLVFAHPGFLRPCRWTGVANNLHLFLYAADLIRSPNGQWCVYADRTQSPSGTGYAVENRIVISRMFPIIFHECQVQRLAPFFVALRETLQSLALRHRDNPRIVLLTPGPSHSTYFEDAYLSRYLGYSLVEGGDLAVRDQRVFLKTLGGLLPVDVILRRLEDEDCDPLELRGDSPFGVPGLLQTIRAGGVAVAHALGNGLVETPVLAPFLPGLCRRLLSEELKLPSVATWWCGQKRELDYVLTHMNQLVIRPAYRRIGFDPVHGDTLSAAEKTALIARIKARPYLFVGQEKLAMSSAPTWDGSRLVPHHIALRTYAAASRGSYVVMDGGVARTSVSSSPLSASLAIDPRSKDAWVLSEGPVQPISLLPPASQPLELRRSGIELPSRVADNLYWLGRLAERAEAVARLLRTILTRITSELDASGLPELPVLFSALAEQTEIAPSLLAALQSQGQGVGDNLNRVEEEVKKSLFDGNRLGSLRSTLTGMHRVASIVRDRISSDAWRILNRVQLEYTTPSESGATQLGDALSVISETIINLAAFSGLAMESMTRAQGWRFLDMGRRMERALTMVSLLRSSLVQSVAKPVPVLEAILDVADSSMTYRSRYLSTLQLAPVLDLLLTDESNPRSVVFQILALSNHVDNLPRDINKPSTSPEQRLSLAALTSVRLVEVTSLCNEQADGTRRELERLLNRLSEQLPKLSDTISHRYLIHSGPSRQLETISVVPTA